MFTTMHPIHLPEYRFLFYINLFSKIVDIKSNQASVKEGYEITELFQLLQGNVFFFLETWQGSPHPAPHKYLKDVLL